MATPPSSNPLAGEQKPGDEASPGTTGTGENICPACGGTGRISSGKACEECEGTGKVVTGIGGG